MMGMKFEGREEKHRITVMAIFLAGACFLTYYCYVVLGTGRVFTHFFYIPIILASLWWKRKGLGVAVFLAALLIFSSIFFRAEVVAANDYLRAIMFIVIAFVVATLSEQIAKAEESLRESEEKYRNLYESSKDGIAFSDMQGNLLDANQAFLDMLGYTIEEYKKLTYQQLTPKKWHKMEADILKNHTMARGYSDEYKKEYIKKDGTVFPATIRIWLIKDKQGKPIGMWAIIRDIAERKQVEEKIKQYQQILEVSERASWHFSHRILSIREEEKKILSTILHDEVGTLAVALSSSLNAIKEEIKDNNLKAALRTIVKSKTVLRKAIQRLKKTAADLRPPDLDIVGLPVALREYLSNVTKQLDLKINFSMEIDEKKVPNNVAIVLYRIVQEALNNVVKHANARNMKVRLYSLGNKIELIIRDDGKGFDTGIISGGTTIHMGIRGMREMAESVDGRFHIKSAPGKGTDIHVTLPVIEEHKLWV